MISMRQFVWLTFSFSNTLTLVKPEVIVRWVIKTDTVAGHQNIVLSFHQFNLLRTTLFWNSLHQVPYDVVVLSIETISILAASHRTKQQKITHNLTRNSTVDLQKLYCRYYELVDRCEISISQMAMNVFCFRIFVLPLSQTSVYWFWLWINKRVSYKIL